MPPSQKSFRESAVLLMFLIVSIGASSQVEAATDWYW
jgi:hypothetical protein